MASGNLEQPEIVYGGVYAVADGGRHYLGVKMSDGSGRVLRFYGNTFYPLSYDDAFQTYVLNFSPDPVPLMIPGTEPINFVGGLSFDVRNFIDADFVFYTGDEVEPGYYEWIMNIIISGRFVTENLLLASYDSSPLFVAGVID